MTALPRNHGVLNLQTYLTPVSPLTAWNKRFAFAEYTLYIDRQNLINPIAVPPSVAPYAYSGAEEHPLVSTTIRCLIAGKGLYSPNIANFYHGKLKECLTY